MAVGGFGGPDGEGDEVDRALLTYAAGGQGGRYIPREASPTVARLRPREEGTTPGFAAQPAGPADPAARCPVHGREDLEAAVVERLTVAAAPDNGPADAARCPVAHGTDRGAAPKEPAP